VAHGGGLIALSLFLLPETSGLELEQISSDDD
jgi:hypothetical protein